MEKVSQFLANFAILVLSFVLQIFHSTCSNNTGFSMKMIMRDSPGSPLYPGNLTQLQRIERLVGFSKARAHYLEGPISSNKSVFDPQKEAKMELERSYFSYFVSFQMGNPATDVYLIMDTGSSMFWTQCLPCSDCYRQSVPIYDSTASSTFAKLPCSSPLCNEIGSPFRCVDNECKFSQRYESGQSCEGDVATETIRFHLAGEGSNIVTGVAFGCARNTASNKGFEDTPVGGVMGLSFGQESIASQLQDIVNRRFSYCLLPFDSKEHEKGILSFGDAVPIPPPHALTVPTLEHPVYLDDHFFYLDLRDISVGSRRLGFPPGMFRITAESGGFIIDSGAALTHLTESRGNPYLQVMTAFRDYYDAKEGLVKATVWGVEDCYYYPEGFNDFVSLTYHFAGADFVVDPRSVSLHGEDRGKFFCIGILPGGSSSILGAVHQQNTRFIFDGHTNTLQFYSDVC